MWPGSPGRACRIILDEGAEVLFQSNWDRLRESHAKFRRTALWIHEALCSECIGCVGSFENRRSSPRNSSSLAWVSKDGWSCGDDEVDSRRPIVTVSGNWLFTSSASSTAKRHSGY